MAKTGLTKKQAKAVARAKAMLSRLKSYECWVSTADTEALRWAQRPFGGPRQFYDRFRAELIKIAREGV
jgi:hypothetical protein